MKRFLTTIAVILAASSLAQSQDKSASQQSSGEEQALMQLEREIAEAYVHGDAKTLERILADDLTGITIQGYVYNRQGLLSEIRPRSGTTLDFLEMKARVYGDAAVVTGLRVFTFKNGDTETVDYFRFTDVFVKRQNGWQMVASQQSSIPVWMARAMEDSELKLLTAQSCSQEPTLKSLNYDVPTFIKFTNATSQAVVFHWINYEGQRDPSENQKQTLMPGQSGYRHTFLTHPFVVTDSRGKCLGIFQPTREPSLAVIK